MSGRDWLEKRLMYVDAKGFGLAVSFRAHQPKGQEWIATLFREARHGTVPISLGESGADPESALEALAHRLFDAGFPT